jgi:plastocyanin
MVPAGVANAVSVFAETSKIPFYVAGVVLVCWALVVAALGIRRAADFPGSARSARLLMLGTAVLVAMTLTAAVLTGSGPEVHAAGAGGARADLAAKASGAPAYDRTDLTLAAGRDAIHFTNPSPVAHNVTIEAAGRVIGASETITGGETTLAVDLEPGSYAFFCSVDAHRGAGMEGALTVH